MLYNGQLLPENELQLPLSNRAFQYNDGFFETIILENGKLRFWPEHQERITEAAAVLGLELPEEIMNETFQERVKELARRNEGLGNARIKLKVWRAGEGLYTPQTDQADWLVTTSPAPKVSEEPLHVGIAQSVCTVPSVFSSFKGIHSPVYVLASREKAAHGLDDVILLDPNGNLAELTASNLFWLKEKTLYTPALTTGCLNGIMRRKLLQWAKQKVWKVQEGLYHPEELASAAVVFAGNVTGLRGIETLNHEPMNLDPDLLQQIRSEIFQSGS
nr:aminotransferase class IV [Rufibacter sediminis]